MRGITEAPKDPNVAVSWLQKFRPDSRICNQNAQPKEPYYVTVKRM